MKKLIGGTVLTAVLLLFAACDQETAVYPTILPEKTETPTPEPTLSGGLTVIPTPEPTKVPPVVEATAIPTVTPEPLTEAPTETPTLTPEPVPEISPTEVPTATPEPTKAPEPTAEPSIELPTVIPEPTETVAPTPTVTPVPTINLEELITKGWQKAVSIDEKYVIIFPEVFRDSELFKTERELRIDYTDIADDAIKFSVCYRMQQTLGESVKEILENAGGVVEQLPGEKRVKYQFQDAERIYCGILIEGQYSKELLGNTFGEEEWITGVMEVMFSYPLAERETYETEQYNYYIITNREE